MKQYHNQLTEITAYINEMMSKHQGVGLSVAIVKDEDIIYSKGFGNARLQIENLPIDGDTLMSIQSISKNFMALSLMQLVEGGLISLDQPVEKYLPYFQTKDKELSNKITIRHVLSHTAGFPSDLGIANMIAPNVREIFSDTPTEFQEALDYYRLTEEEINSIHNREDITRWFKKVELEYSPGEGWNYCTDAYVILADLFEKVTRIPWETHLKENILSPLNMQRTTNNSRFVEMDDNSAKYYLGEAKQETPFPKNEISAPIGYLYSTANDLARYVRFHLNKDTSILRSDLIEEMQQPIHLVSEEWQTESKEKSYGLAWFTNTFKGVRIVEHGGGQMAVRSLMSIVPEHKLGIVVLLNFDGTIHRDISRKVIDTFISKK